MDARLTIITLSQALGQVFSERATKPLSVENEICYNCYKFY